MKKFLIFILAVIFAVSTAGFALADDSEMLKANEKAAWEKATKAFPPERQLNVEQFKKVYDRVMAGQEEAYLVDLRTHPEFYAGHILGTNHIHAGHMYTFPKKIKVRCLFFLSISFPLGSFFAQGDSISKPKKSLFCMFFSISSLERFNISIFFMQIGFITSSLALQLTYC